MTIGRTAMIVGPSREPGLEVVLRPVFRHRVPKAMFRFLCRLASLVPALLSLLPLKGCKPAPPPAVAGVSIDLRYPVLLIGQKTFDVRNSEAELINVPGASSLNLIERVILDSDGRLFEVVSARVEAGAKPVLLDMGTSRRRHEVVLRELKKPSFEKVQELALAEIRAPNSYWSDEPGYAAKAEARIRSLHNVEELIVACGEYWNWTR